MKMPSVSIILATFNGGKYLHAQLESIRQCHMKNMTIVVVDDNSSDNTDCILSQYALEMNILKYKSQSSELNTIKRIRDNFIFGLKRVNTDYYFFCDQDDVWGTKKIPSYLMALEANNVVYSNYTAFGTFFKKTNVKDFRNMTTFNLLISNVCPGMCVAFDKTSKEILIQNADIIHHHDHGLFLCARKHKLKVEKITQNGLNWYRQHDKNAIGLKNIPKSKMIFIRFFKFLTNFVIYKRIQ